MVIIVTGGIGAGKTTVCSKLISVVRNKGITCGGILTCKAIDKSITIEDIQSGEKETLASISKSRVGPRTPRYFFNPKGIAFGIQSIEKGQWEASYALGLSWSRQMRHVILPQAIQRILPPLAGEFINTIKNSSIVSIISIQELTFQGMELMAATYLTFEIWLTIMGMYLILTLLLSLGAARFENYIRRSLA